MKVILLLTCLTLAVRASWWHFTQSPDDTEDTAVSLNLTSFRKDFFWETQEQGLFEVDVGLLDVSQQHLAVFVDLNADKYTDIVTIDEEQTRLSFYLFNTKKLVFELWSQLEPAECKKVTNTVVGQSTKHLRLFVTCLSL